jgi:hypothetical protein
MATANPIGFQTTAPSVTPTHAAIINSRYTVNKSNFIGIVKRYNDTIANMTPQAQRNWQSNLAAALKAFRKNHPKLKNFSDRKYFRLCQAQEITIGNIVIDTTMQREPDMSWILKIITNFRAYQAQPIQVYKNSDGHWGAWDGQHTALALYLIATDLGLDINDVTIPGCIYDIQNRGELRGNFINNNTTVGKNAGKKPLDLIDIIQQMIYGVLVDGVTDPEWVDMANKHKLIAASGMFLTAEKFGDSAQPGAITRMEELKDASVEVVRQFCVYGKFIVDTQQRAIDTKELPIIIEFLNMCERDQIVYTDDEIRDMAQHLDRWFNCNFDSKGPYWTQVYQANLNAYNAAHQGLPKHLWPDAPKNLKNVPYGTTFFWHQLRNSWAGPKGKKFKFPKNSFNVFVPAVSDLW